MEVLILVGLILLNGLFAMSEIALVTARRSRLQKQVEAGNRSAAVALELGQQPTRFLSTIQIGITSIGILNGIVGEATLAKPVAAWLLGFGLEDDTASIMATALVVIAITYFTIVVGELVPKRIGQVEAERIATLVARPMRWLGLVTRPFGRLLSGSTEILLKLMGVRSRADQSVTEEDIEAMLAEGSSSGVIEQTEHTMVRNVFRLDDRQISSLMIPRSAVVYLDLQDPPEVNLQKLEGAEHSRFPVADGSLDRVLGVANAKALLAQTLRGEPWNLLNGMQPAVFVPETLTGMELLDNFRSNNIQMALVVDEYGELQGMVTLQDVLEAITGEFKPHHADDSWAVQRPDGSWLLDGLIPLPELRDRLRVGPLPE